LNSSKIFKKSCLSFDLNKKPFLPFSKISVGPLLQSLEIIVVFAKAASTKTKPGSSQREDKINASASAK